MNAASAPRASGSPGAAPRIRVVLADDSVLLREGVARILAEAGFEVVGQAGTAEDLLRLVRETLPDVAVVDIRMPPTHTDEGVRAADAIHAAHGTAVGVLILSQYVDAAFALRVVTEGRGGVGYLLKDRVADVDEFSEAVRRVSRGGTVIDPEVVALLVNRRRARGPLDDLTEREREVLALMAEGRSNQAISDRLFVTPKTIEAHIASIFSKLELLPAPDDHRRVLAVLAYLRT
jgi:DNA-binding NarL/FixJ family response regulator